jgi:hypothetical protein
VVVVCIKYDRLPMKLLQVFIPGKIDEYKVADLLIVRSRAPTVAASPRPGGTPRGQSIYSNDSPREPNV